MDEVNISAAEFWQASAEANEREIELLRANWAGSADTCSRLHKKLQPLEAEIERLRAALQRIAELHPETDSEEGNNEWGEADCFNQAQKLAHDAISVAALDQIAEVIADGSYVQQTGERK